MSDALTELEAVLRDRLDARPTGSYSVTLLTDSEQARRKVMEEAFELCLELGRDPVDPERTAEEAADLLFHVAAALVGAGQSLSSALAVLERRRT